MPGTRTNANPVRHVAKGYSAAAVTAAQIIGEEVLPFACRVLAIKVNGVTAGTGGGNTVVDVLRNGVTIYTTAANRPTLAATSTGEFQNTAPDVKAFLAGDRITIQVASISSTGHARLMAEVALGLPA